MKAFALAAAVSVMMSGCTAQDTPGAPDAPTETAIGDKPKLGLMTTLPILWSGHGEFGDMLSGEEEPHWARGVLSEKHDLQALDVLTPAALDEIALLVLAQPRMLSGEENVALDEWVRGGGHVLVFADPMLTEHSDFGIGDKRRPQDVALLDPILARWGMTLDAGPPKLETTFAPLGAAQIPLRAEGFLEFRDPAGGAEARCTHVVGRILARCDIGSGRAVVLSDAAVLEAHPWAEEGIDEPSEAALRELLGIAGERTRSRPGKTGE